MQDGSVSSVSAACSPVLNDLGPSEVGTPIIVFSFFSGVGGHGGSVLRYSAKAGVLPTSGGDRSVGAG